MIGGKNYMVTHRLGFSVQLVRIRTTCVIRRFPVLWSTEFRQTQVKMQHNPPPRITFGFIGEQLLEQLNLERGLGYTLKSLLWTPGKAIQEYLFNDRDRLMRPFSFLLLMAAVTTFLTLHLLLGGKNLQELSSQAPEMQQLPLFLQAFTQKATSWTQQYYNLIYMSTLPAMALSTFLLFRKVNWHYAEHLVLNAYVYGFQSFIYLLIIPLYFLHPILFAAGALLMVVYLVYAYYRIFSLSWWEAILFTLVAYLISQVVYGVFFFLVVGVATAYSLP